MKFERCPLVELSDGKIVRMYPFHLSMEGMESKMLCKDDEDYDTFVKVLAVSAYKKEVSLVVYCVVSNHVHCVVLARTKEEAYHLGNECKRVYSMYLTRKYGEESVMRGIDIHIVYLDSDNYLRNAIGYDLRNALDNSANIHDYRWSSYRAPFCGGKAPGKRRKVANLNKRDKRTIMHTHDKLHKVSWLINDENHLEPVSFTNWRYLEKSFFNKHSFFLKTIGMVSTSEIKQKLVENLKERKTDNELFKCVNEICNQRYSKNLNELSSELKARVLLFTYRSYRCTPAQLARVFELSREKVLSLLGQVG